MTPEIEKIAIELYKNFNEYGYLNIPWADRPFDYHVLWINLARHVLCREIECRIEEHQKCCEDCRMYSDFLKCERIIELKHQLSEMRKG